ncbi:MAG: aconitase family protein, partial [Bacteroidales bacterium]
MNGLAELRRLMTTPLGKVTYYSLKKMHKNGRDIEEFPFTIRILAENILRNYNGTTFNRNHLDNIINWTPEPARNEIPYLPARVLMQDFTGVPSIVDIASLRSEIARRGKDPGMINPEIPVDLVIDHSVQIDYFGTDYAYQRNVDLEYERNHERYSLLKWAQSSFGNFSVLPPGLGICHQVNLEYLAKVVMVKDGLAFPDTLVGTDSHTPMVNGIGVAGWGVGGIEAEAAMLGQPVHIMLPEVVGLRLTGAMKPGTTSTDLVLTVAEMLRKKGVVGKFVEVFGDGLDHLTVPDRATISNMSPEFGCTMTYFPPDNKTIEYLKITGRDARHIGMVEEYLRTNMLWRENEDKIKFTEVIGLDLGSIEPSIAGPKRPQDKIVLRNLKDKFIEILKSSYERRYVSPDAREVGRWSNEGGHQEELVPEPSGRSETLEAVGIEIEPESKKMDGLKSVRIKVN